MSEENYSSSGALVNAPCDELSNLSLDGLQHGKPTCRLPAFLYELKISIAQHHELRLNDYLSLKARLAPKLSVCPVADRTHGWISSAHSCLQFLWDPACDSL